MKRRTLLTLAALGALFGLGYRIGSRKAERRPYPDCGRCG
jgi:hypothetical protein